MNPVPALSEVEQQAWEMWQQDHPESAEYKSWLELPWWVQRAYLTYLEAM